MNYSLNINTNILHTIIKYLFITPFKLNINLHTKIKNKAIKANEETDNYCYSIILLNFLYQDNICKLSLDEFYNYIDYLNSIGINNNLINIFYNLYTNKSNENPVEYLDSLDNNCYKAMKKIYEYKKGK